MPKTYSESSIETEFAELNSRLINNRYEFGNSYQVVLAISRMARVFFDANIIRRNLEFRTSLTLPLEYGTDHRPSMNLFKTLVDAVNINTVNSRLSATLRNHRNRFL